MQYQLFTPDEFNRYEKPLRDMDKLFQGFAKSIKANLIYNRHSIPNRVFEWNTGDGLTRVIEVAGVTNDPNSSTGLSARLCGIGIVVCRIAGPISKGFRFADLPMPTYSRIIGEYEKFPAVPDEMQALLEDAYQQVMDIKPDDLR